MRLAWTQPRFSYSGTFYTCRDLEVLPRPYQYPHPPFHQAAATRDTFVAIGNMGLRLLVALIGTPMAELASVIAAYQAAWRAAGHPGQGEVRLRLPIYVAETLEQAQTDPRPSVMSYYERLRQSYLRSAQQLESAERTAQAAQLATLTYEDSCRNASCSARPGTWRNACTPCGRRWVCPASLSNPMWAEGSPLNACAFSGPVRPRGCSPASRGTLTGT